MENMSIAQALLPEFDYEMANTRKTLERVPEDKFSFKPDPKSMSMGRLAGHIAEMPGWGVLTLSSDSLTLDPATHKPFAPSTRAEILAEFDKNVASTRTALAAASDADIMQPWSLIIGGNPLFTMPRIGVIRSMVMNHVIHHRAQLTVYFRLNGVPVPALYGPSADEGNMPAAANA
jgi:uncharacterized damage-inducible protein DinB